jgi:hypothetical protein
MVLGWVLAGILGYKKDENYIITSTVIVLSLNTGPSRKD